MAYVIQPYVGTSQKTRNRKISAELEALLSAVAAETGVTFKVTSGGQFAKGKGPRVKGSSVRHDDGGAADVEAYDANGNVINFTTPEGKATWERIVSLARASGATGIGAGVDYMGPTTVHIGFGKPAVWSSKTSGQPVEGWLRTAYDRGGKIPPLNIPDVASLTDTQRAPVAPMPLPSFMRPSASSAAPLSKTLGGGIPDAAMFGVRPGGTLDMVNPGAPGTAFWSESSNAFVPVGFDPEAMSFGSSFPWSTEPGIGDLREPRTSAMLAPTRSPVVAPTAAETRAEQMQMRTGSEPDRSRIGAGSEPAVPLPRSRPSTNDGSSDLLQQALNQRAARMRDEMGFGTITAPSMAETRAEQAQMRAPAPSASSGALRAVTPGVQPAGSVQMAAARPSSVPIPANEFQFLAPAPGAASQPVVAPTMAETRNEMALMRARPAAAMTAPTPFPSRGVPVTPAPMPLTPSPMLRSAPQPMPQRPALSAPSAQVRDLQSALTARGFNPGSADGIFGPRTDAAVRAFQQANGLAVDGIVGPQTLAALSRQQAPTPMPSLPRSIPSQQQRSAPTPMPSTSRPAGYGSKGYSEAGKQLLAMFG